MQAATWQAGIGGKAPTLGSARNCSIDNRGRRRRNFLACGSHNTACRTVGTHRHFGTAHRVAGAGSSGSSIAVAMSSGLIPSRDRRVKHRWHTAMPE